jgi:hypothetical protein
MHARKPSKQPEQPIYLSIYVPSILDGRPVVASWSSVSSRHLIRSTYLANSVYQDACRRRQVHRPWIWLAACPCSRGRANAVAAADLRRSLAVSPTGHKSSYVRTVLVIWSHSHFASVLLFVSSRSRKNMISYKKLTRYQHAVVLNISIESLVNGDIY